MDDFTGGWPKWINHTVNWVNNKIIQPIKELFPRQIRVVYLKLLHMMLTEDHIQESREVLILHLMVIQEHMDQIELQSMIMTIMIMEDRISTPMIPRVVIIMIGRMVSEDLHIVSIGNLFWASL